MSNQKEKKIKAKKGSVINRRNNRTVDQSVATTFPKWEDLGEGVMRRFFGPNFSVCKMGTLGRLVSLTSKEVAALTL
jgi:hypothetical protein